MNKRAGIRPPLLSQSPTHRRSQHGLAEAFEDLRDAFEAGFGGFHLGQQGVEFVGDDFLFSEGWKSNIGSFKFTLCYVPKPNSSMRTGNEFVQCLVDCISQKAFVDQSFNKFNLEDVLIESCSLSLPNMGTE